MMRFQRRYLDSNHNFESGFEPTIDWRHMAAIAVVPRWPSTPTPVTKEAESVCTDITCCGRREGLLFRIEAGSKAQEQR